MKYAIYNRYFAFLALLLLVGLQGCAGTNPIAVAETPEQRAFAMYGTFVIFSEKAADLAEQTSLPRSVRLGLVNAEERAKPVADSLLDAYTEFLVIKAEFDAGDSGDAGARLLRASQSLNDAITRLAPLLNELVRSIKGAED